MGLSLEDCRRLAVVTKKSLSAAVPLTTPAQLTNHFAQGHFSIDLKPTRGSAVSTFPTIQVNAGTKVGSVTLGLGVRTTVGPLAQPATIASLADSVNVRAQPHCATLSIPFFYRLLRNLTRWSTLTLQLATKCMHSSRRRMHWRMQRHWVDGADCACFL